MGAEMKACLDVHYGPRAATAAAVVFESWPDAEPRATYTAQIDEVAAYRPGRFFLRELGPLNTVIEAIAEPIGTWVVDAYCHLDARRSPGLGAHLCDSLGGCERVIGVAKSRFRESTHAAELLRGGSRRPLFITAVGLGVEEAVRCVESMAGEHRIPELIKLADRLARRRVAKTTAAP